MATQLPPPGPSAGRINEFLFPLRNRDPLALMFELSREYGDVAGFRAGGQQYFLLNHPNFIREVLVTHKENFLKGRGKRRRTQFLGNGLIISEGETHRRQRKLMQPAFHRERIVAYTRVMVDQGALSRDQWHDGAVFDVAQAMRRITIPIVSRTLFHTETAAEAEEVDRAMTGVLTHFRAFRSVPAFLLEKFPLPESRRFRQAWQLLDQIIYKMIDDRWDSEEDHGDLLSMLLLADEEGESLTREEVRDQAMTIFIAGYETTALALAWTWYLLAQHTEIEGRLHSELDSVLEGRLPTFEDVPLLTYTGQIFNEALRLYPPTWRLVRWAIKDCSFGGYIVPAESQVIVSQYLTHHDARYFPDPFRFDPSRWTREQIASRPLYSFFPFGSGARRCIGEMFAIMEGVLLLATIAQQWRLRLAPGPPVELQPLHMLRPRYGIQMRAERRT